MDSGKAEIEYQGLAIGMRGANEITFGIVYVSHSPTSLTRKLIAESETKIVKRVVTSATLEPFDINRVSVSRKHSMYTVKSLVEYAQMYIPDVLAKMPKKDWSTKEDIVRIILKNKARFPSS